MNYKPYLKWTHIASSVVLVGLIAWNVYFSNALDPFRDPYSGSAYEDRQVDTIEVGGNEESIEPEQPESENQPDEDADENEQHTEMEETPGPIGVYGVSSAHPLAAEAGMEILEQGGNAIDAAVAVSLTLNVVEPYGSGIGGGGLMMVHDPEEGALTYDYREAAAESSDLFNGNSLKDNQIAVPGLVDGLHTAHSEMGELPWDELFDTPINYAREGFDVGNIFYQQTGNAARRLEANMDADDFNRFFPEGQTLEVNETLEQEELAETFELIREDPSAFYDQLAETLAEDPAFGFTEEDFSAYETQVTDPVEAEIGDQTVYGGPSPSSGAVVVQGLQLAEQLEETGHLETILEENLPEGEELNSDSTAMQQLVNEPEHLHSYMHLVNEIAKVTYSSRLDTLGDPEFADVEHAALTDDTFISELLENMSYEGISAPGELFDSPAETADARHTTHFVIIDQDGRMVSSTHSLGEFYGSGYHIDGFFLNNQMNNFSDNEESPNYFEPGKRPRTFVAPMIFEEKGRPVLGIGSPGGRRIPVMLLQTILQYQHGINEDGEEMNLQEAIEHPRFYNEDDVIYVEDEDISPEAVERLRGEDYQYSVVSHTSPLFYGGIQATGLTLNDGGDVTGIYGGGDPRRNGAWQIDQDDME
ncbi:gamma-glutamyltransferase family protein [Alkalicoccus chagannorensis]|uniref:gamma-glutamyltransferase family protein n=1 Tax=Alkalicoccus chagannorensis TaxID=427072 RepID=UPI000410A069|nr:gamma-glutamyltransferase [Alkalicoccus chagannorensis]